MARASKIFSRRLKKHLEFSGITASAIAGKSGLTAQAVLNYAKGKNEPTLGSAENIAKALGYRNLSDFLRESDGPSIEEFMEAIQREYARLLRSKGK